MPFLPPNQQVKALKAQVKLTSVVTKLKVNVPTLEVDDLLRASQWSNDLHWLLLSIYQRWTKYFRLLEEIEPLRRRCVQ